MVVGRASTLEEGARLAAQTIDSGAAAKTLDAYVAASNGAAS
jgi:anthranilate phosphoribosyltransferase